MPPITIRASENMPTSVNGRELALAHPEASLVMITSVATCITPRIPAL